MKLGIIGGTGIGERLIEGLGGGSFREERVETPFGPPAGPIHVGTLQPSGGRPVDTIMLSRHGEAHECPPHKVPYRANIFAFKMLGVTHVLATGAVGSLRDHIAPGELVVCDQVIDRTCDRPRTFFDTLAVHVEMAQPFCPVMRRWLCDAARRIDVRVHPAGTYVCIEGPSFSTRAESHMHRMWGGDVVGMTAMPEARLAREAELPYALLALPTDYDCWRERDGGGASQAGSVLEDIIANLRNASEAAFALILAALSDRRLLEAEASPAATALRSAIWTDYSGLPMEDLGRLGPIIARYLEM